MSAGPDFTALPDLALRSLGGSVVAANDEFFAEKENLIKPSTPTYQGESFGHKGQVYDGWETRRRRGDGHDWAIVRLGLPGVIRGVIVDTAHFTGNYPPYCSVQACSADGHPSPDELSDWVQIVPRSELTGHTAHRFDVTVTPRRFTHVRLSIYPDGGVARLRVHGEVVPDPRFLADLPIDLAALENGALVTGCSNAFYSRPDNLLAPGLAQVMGDGWETARRRDDGNDWVTVRLAGRGLVRIAELDTTHFKGNAPAVAALSGRDGDEWFPLLARTRLQSDTRHRFLLPGDRPVTDARLDIYPDGGLARLRLYGRLTPDGLAALSRRWDSLRHGRQGG